jgi:hypothetical protein
VFEQAGSSKQVLVVDLSSSSDEEDFIADTSWDAEFARRLFGDLNHDVLGPPDGGKVNILRDSDEEEQMREETAVDTEAVTSAAEKSSTLAAYAATDDEDSGKMQDDNSDDLAPERGMDKVNIAGDEVGSP